MMQKHNNQYTGRNRHAYLAHNAELRRLRAEDKARKREQVRRLSAEDKARKREELRQAKADARRFRAWEKAQAEGGTT
jgi:hypothetical protein